MLDPRYRKSCVTNQVIDNDAEHPFWLARFRMPSKDGRRASHGGAHRGERVRGAAPVDGIIQTRGPPMVCWHRLAPSSVRVFFRVSLSIIILVR
jgi:hypothetical protein